MTELNTTPPDGLLHALELDGNGGGRDLDWDEIATCIREKRLVWVHLDYTMPIAQRWVRTQSGLDESIAIAMTSEETRPRLRVHGDGMMVIMRGVNMNPGADPEDMVSIRVWLEPHLIISSRRRRLLSVPAVYESLKAGRGPATPGDFIVRLAAELEDRIGGAVEQLDESIEAAENAFANRDPAEAYRGEFSALRRQAAGLRRYLVPQREALEQMSRHSNAVLTPENCSSLREETDKMTRYLEDLDLIRERSMVAQEELLGQLAHEQNSRIYVLSLVAAIFLPLSFLTGLMGMNVAGLPGTENPWAFGVLVVLMLAAAGGIMLLFKYKKWL